MLNMMVNLSWPDGDYDRQDAMVWLNELLAQASGEDPIFLATLLHDTLERLINLAALHAARVRENPKEVTGSPWIGSVTVTSDDPVERDSLAEKAEVAARLALQLQATALNKKSQHIGWSIEELEQHLLGMKVRLLDDSKA